MEVDAERGRLVMGGQPLITLRDGVTIPQLGLGMYIGRDPAGSADIVLEGLKAGYRHLDTARVYGNEDAVGDAVRRSGLPRDDIFVTTKVWNTDQGYDATLAAFDASLKRLGTEYVDLYLIHWPCPAKNLYVDTWKALIRVQEDGRVRSIGVSNFYPEHLRRIIAETGVTPVLNQVELHPNFQQTDLRAFHAGQGIATESWSPLGRTKIFGPAIAAIAEKHGKSTAQVIIRWHLQSGLIVIPRSTNPGRIAENFASLSFELDAQDMDALAGLDDPLGRIDADPLKVN